MATAIQPSLKHLSASGHLSSVPSIFISRSTEAEELESVEEEEIPVIDLSLLRGSEDQRSQAVRDLGRACQEWGFFMVVNHGVPEELRSKMVAALNEFFDLPDEEKIKYTRKNVMDPVQYGSSYNVAVEEVRYWRDFLKVFLHPEFNSPDKPPGFREILQEYSTSTRDMARELLKGIWESLELDISSMDDALNLNSSFGLFVNGVDGLQVMHNGRWVQIKPLPDSFLINTGDHLEIVSNGRYKSVLHRATLNMKSTRMSLVSSIGPSMDTIVIPAPELVSREDRKARYRGMSFKDFLECQQKNKLKGKAVLDLLRLPAE